MEARVTNLEAAVQDTRDRLVRIEARLDLSSTKEDTAKLDGSIRSDMHKEFNAQTWRIIGAMLTFGGALTCLLYTSDAADD